MTKISAVEVSSKMVKNSWVKRGGQGHSPQPCQHQGTPLVFKCYIKNQPYKSRQISKPYVKPKTYVKTYHINRAKVQKPYVKPKTYVKTYHIKRAQTIC
jgi:hypothetical protein